MKVVDLGEPTSLLDHVYLGCTQRQCQISKDVVDNCLLCSNQGFLPGLQKKTETRPDANTLSSWSYDKEGDAKNCVERCCEIANKTTDQLYIVATPLHVMIINLKKKKMDRLEHYLLFAHKLF